MFTEQNPKQPEVHYEKEQNALGGDEREFSGHSLYFCCKPRVAGRTWIWRGKAWYIKVTLTPRALEVLRFSRRMIKSNLKTKIASGFACSTETRLPPERAGDFEPDPQTNYFSHVTPCLC